MKKLLIVVDYQVDFVSGILGNKDALSIERNIVNKIKAYEDNNEDVIFTFDTHYENYMETQEGKNLPFPHCIDGTEGHKLYGEVKNHLKGHLSFYKNTFPSLALANYLKDKEYDEVELVGVVTDICVIANAIMVKSSLPEANIIIDASCCASNNRDRENAAYEVMLSQQMKVINRK